MKALLGQKYAHGPQESIHCACLLAETRWLLWVKWNTARMIVQPPVRRVDTDGMWKRWNDITRTGENKKMNECLPAGAIMIFYCVTVIASSYWRLQTCKVEEIQTYKIARACATIALALVLSGDFVTIHSKNSRCHCLALILSFFNFRLWVTQID